MWTFLALQPVFKELMLHAIYDPLCKHLWFLSELLDYFKLGVVSKQQKVTNQQINTYLSLFKGLKRKDIKKNQKTSRNKF